MLIREDDAFHPEGAKKNYTRIRVEKEKESQLDGIKDPDGGKDLEASTVNWFFLFTARIKSINPQNRRIYQAVLVHLHLQWIMFFTCFLLLVIWCNLEG